MRKNIEQITFTKKGPNRTTGKGEPRTAKEQEGRCVFLVSFSDGRDFVASVAHEDGDFPISHVQSDIQEGQEHQSPRDHRRDASTKCVQHPRVQQDKHEFHDHHKGSISHGASGGLVAELLRGIIGSKEEEEHADQRQT